MMNVRHREFSRAQFVVRPTALLATAREVGSRALQLFGRQIVRNESGDLRKRRPHALGVAAGVKIVEIDLRSAWLRP